MLIWRGVMGVGVIVVLSGRQGVSSSNKDKDRSSVCTAFLGVFLFSFSSSL